MKSYKFIIWKVWQFDSIQIPYKFLTKILNCFKMNSDRSETCFSNAGGSPTSFGKKIFFMAIWFHTNSILWNLYGIKLPYYGICMISNSNQFCCFVQKAQFLVHVAGRMSVDVDLWVYWALTKKNERKTNENSRFFWFWALFVIKHWSSVVCSSAPLQVYVQMAVIDVGVVKISVIWALTEKN